MLFPLLSVSFFWRKRFGHLTLLKYFLIFIFLFFSSFIKAQPKLINEILSIEKDEIGSFVSVDKILIATDHPEKSNQNSHKSNTTNGWVNDKVLYAVFIIVIIGSVIFLAYRNKKKTFLDRNDVNIVDDIKQINEQDLNDILKEPIKNINFITDETSTAILKKLMRFESSDKYLRKDINLTWLANHLNTNTKYISEVIKIHRNKNFNNYINGLRIDYIIQKLSENPVYREYKITYLAEECGYASPQVFVIAFKKESGVTPSNFIEQLKTQSGDNYQESVS